MRAIKFIVMTLSFSINLKGVDSFEDKVYGQGDKSWMNVGDCGAGLTCDPKCQLECLKMHNYYRALHDSPPLSCDPELAKSAQAWTDTQAAHGNASNSLWTDKFTENILWKGLGWQGMDKMEGAIPGAVRSWYSEIKFDYNYEAGEGNGQVIGHFQAVTWKGEKRLGCGLNIKAAGVKAGTFVTAHYAPASHVSMDKKKQAPDNIKPRKQPEEGCNQRSSERELSSSELEAPFVKPEDCIKNGFCYDDMFMSERNVWYYEPKGSVWCFTKKGEPPGAQSTQQPSMTSGTVPPSGPTQQPGSQPSSSALATVLQVTPRAGQTPGSQPNLEAFLDNCFASSCYTFVESGEKWTENQNACKGKGGDLVSMETEEEWRYINNKIQQITLPSSDEWHIGLKNEGDWKWVNGEPLTIEKWQRSQPSGDGEVTVMSKNYPPGSKGLFNDLPDYIPKAYICEIPKELPSTPSTAPSSPTEPSSAGSPNQPN